MTTILESVCADAWTPMAERRLGEWRLRAAGGYTGRANSALAVGDPGMRVPAALAEITRFSHLHRIPPKAQVVVGSAVEDVFSSAGWRVDMDHPKGAESAVLVADLAPGGGTAVHRKPPVGWMECAVGDQPNRTHRHVLTSGPELGFAAAESGGDLVGVARGCVVRGWLHVSVLAVADEHRRRGLGRSLMAGLNTWAAGLGARGQVLQVAVDNARALALYSSMGFRESHRYRYWVPGA